MKVENGYILNFPHYVSPVYRISPFKTEHMHENKIIYAKNNENTAVNHYIKSRFENYNFVYTIDGRSAIEKALLALELGKNDTVTIFTTTNNKYISSCVTEKIENFCSWSRKVETTTKAILVNHEFGYCIEDMEYYKSLGFPIIEDFAHSFSASNSSNSVGKYADFLVFSLSKFFPMQLGGILVYKKKYNSVKDDLDSDSKRYIQNVVSEYIESIENINAKRIENFNMYKKFFQSINIVPTLQLNKFNVPAVFMFDVDKDVDLNLMKQYLNNHGIESSVFNGQQSYFVPNHQNLSNEDIEYIFTVVKNFLQECKK